MLRFNFCMLKTCCKGSSPLSLFKLDARIHISVSLSVLKFINHVLEVGSFYMGFLTARRISLAFMLVLFLVFICSNKNVSTLQKF